MSKRPDRLTLSVGDTGETKEYIVDGLQFIAEELQRRDLPLSGKKGVSVSRLVALIGQLGHVAADEIICGVLIAYSYAMGGDEHDEERIRNNFDFG